MTIGPIQWTEDGVVLLDQRALPGEERYLTFRDYRKIVEAIGNLIVRGAPAIGVTAAMGLALALKEAPRDREAKTTFFRKVCREFAASRPTAVNLFWAIERMTRRFEEEMKRTPTASRRPCSRKP